MGEGLALSLYIIYNICGLHSESGCSPHCLSLHGSNVFPKERSNAKGAMMSFASKRPDVFPWERSCISWTVMLLVSSQVRWALEAVFWWSGRLPPGGGKDVAVVLQSVSPGAWKTVLGGRENEA